MQRLLLLLTILVSTFLHTFAETFEFELERVEEKKSKFAFLFEIG